MKETGFSSLSNSDKSKAIAVIFIMFTIFIFSVLINYKAVKNSKEGRERNWVIFMIVFTLVGGFAVRHIAGTIEALKGE